MTPSTCPVMKNPWKSPRGLCYITLIDGNIDYFILKYTLLQNQKGYAPIYPRAGHYHYCGTGGVSISTLGALPAG